MVHLHLARGSPEIAQGRLRLTLALNSRQAHSRRNHPLASRNSTYRWGSSPEAKLTRWDALASIGSGHRTSYTHSFPETFLSFVVSSVISAPDGHSDAGTEATSKAGSLGRSRARARL
ncbi:hypothetical protein GQ53DRAFT_755105 [Thozetella sp. PMI_491]|nr:hypothetical protein GQ53DRAFT_755105 [Thozetella sp. PMI_491]